MIFAALAHNPKTLKKGKAEKRSKKYLETKPYIILFSIFFIVKEEILFKMI